MPFLTLRKNLAKSLSDFLNNETFTPEFLEGEFGLPPQLNLGHVALPCFKLSKQLKEGSDKIAKRIAEQFNTPGVTVTPTGPYANFKFSVRLLYEETMKAIYAEKERFGGDKSGGGKKVIIEYCSPNVAKKLGFHHIRTTLLGNTLANIYDALGYQTVRLNFIGDWGAQFAKLFAAVEKWGDMKVLREASPNQAMDHLLEVYVRFHKAMDEDATLNDHANQCLKRLEEGEPAAKALWQKIRDISILTMGDTLKRLSIRFDDVESESDYVPEIAPMLEEVKKKASAKISDGAWIVEVPGISTPALIQKKDGTTLYLTRDIAAAVDRFNRYKFDKMFYVVSEQQRLHFQLLFGVLKLMGFSWADRCEHLSYGTVLFGSEKMSTREGKVIFLDGLLTEAKEKALAECMKKNPDLQNKEEVAEMVGVGAVIFGNLSSNKKSDIEFKWENVLALDGETGPYVQYSSVRCESLLQKAREKGEKVGYFAAPENYEFASEEEALVLMLSRFRATLHQVIGDNEPYHLTHYLIDLAKAFNRFYYKLPVLQSADENQRRLRLSLVAATHQTLSNGLGLLGIRCPKEM